MHLRVQPTEMTIRNVVIPVGQWRNLMRLALLEAMRLSSNGDSAGAWRWYLASLRYCSHHGMHGSLTDRIGGATMYSFCVERIVSWARNPALTSHQLEQSLADVRAAYELSSDPSVSIRREYFYLSNALTYVEEHPGEYNEFLEGFDPRLHNNLILPSRSRIFLKNEPELTRRLLRHQTANLLEFADEPLCRQPEELLGQVDFFDVTDSTDSVRLSSSEFRTALEKSAIAPLLLRTIVPRGIHRERAREGLLEMLLAAEWYRRETGEFPASTDELLTAPMLDEIPLDALSRSGALLGYERDPDNPQRAKVWSVGRNGVDDGGSLEHVFAPHPGRPDLGYWIGEPESTAAEL